MQTMLLFVLVALPVAAEVPGGHLYFGAGASWMVPVSSSGAHSWGDPLGSHPSLSLELTYEFESAFLAGSMEYNGFGSSPSPEVSFSSVRAGWIFGTASVAPFAAVGIGRLSETVGTSFDRGTPTNGNGAAGTAELGVLLFRHLRFGRLALSARWIEPFFLIPPAPGALATGNGEDNRLPLFTFGLRGYL